MKFKKEDISKMRDAIFKKIEKDEDYIEKNSNRYDGDYKAGYFAALAMARGIINSVNEEMIK